MHHVTVIASLYIEALRQGQPLWFQVASSSMRPLLHRNDTIHIEPASAHQLRIGDIAAFETTYGLVTHRIIARHQQGSSLLLLQMADSIVDPAWIQEKAVVGRVTAIRQGTRYLRLQSPLAKICGTCTALIRFQLYSQSHSTPVQRALTVSSRIALRLSCSCIRLFCLSSQL